MNVGEFYTKTGSTISYKDFSALADQFFRARFNATGNKTAAVMVNEWQDEDGRDPFFVMCVELAEKIRAKYEFCPLDIEVFGSAAGPERFETNFYCGLLIRHDGNYFRISLTAGTTRVEVTYDYPGGHIETHEDGSTSANSHSSVFKFFDLNDPDSVENIAACSFGFLERMIRT